MSANGQGSGSIRDRIRSTADVRSEIVEVEQWGVKVEVRSMTGRERAAYLQAATDENGDPDFVAMFPAVVVATCFDPETGERVFQEGDESWLPDKAAAPLDQLARVGLRLSGIDLETQDREGARFPRRQ
jgi:hypothetical protein